MLQETNASGTSTYVYGGGGRLISQTDGAGTQLYSLADGLGSTAALTDSNDVVAATSQYDVFGAVRSSTGTASTTSRFAGQQQDATTGLTYLRARYYDPATGRFLSRDPLPGVVGSPASQHAYAYAHNSPAQYTDPSGQFIPLVLAAIAATGLTVGDIAFAGAVTVGVTATVARVYVLMDERVADVGQGTAKKTPTVAEDP